MNDRPNNLQSPEQIPTPSCPADDWDDDLDALESWQVHLALHEKKDYPALVEYCKKEVKRNPGDPHAQCRLGEAYVLNRQYEMAIDFMGKCQRRFPEIVDFQHVALDALFAMGKTEDDFDWVKKPVVLRLNKEVLDFCYDYLRPKRKPREIEELRIQLMFKGYVTFSCEELLQALDDDGRFVVERAECAFWSQVRIARKREPGKKARA